MPARPPAAPLATLDHLVVAAATLADGIDYVAAATGATPLPGGKHVAMGTHNALLRLGERAYLEIIAIDPDGAKPARRRWFDLDDIALQAELTEQPRLDPLGRAHRRHRAAAAASPLPLGTVHSMQRGDYRWRITIPDDGARPGRGLVPTLIQWDVPAHPADTPAEVERDAGAARRHPPGARRRCARRWRRWGSRGRSRSPTTARRGSRRCCARRGGW